ncbi:MAG: hypothetical protein ACFCU1_03600 [Sumerlaeia bacterium]
MNFFKLLFVSLIMLFSIIAMGGCERGPEKKPIEFDPNYSVNTVPTPYFWPREKMDWPKNELDKSIRQTTYQNYGKPDYLRNVYTVDRRVVRPKDLLEGIQLPGKKSSITIEWIYLEEELVIEFDGPRVIEHELDDLLRTVCIYGDPGIVRDHVQANGDINQVYLYYNHGKEFTFNGTKLIKERTLSSTLPGAERMKE